MKELAKKVIGYKYADWFLLISLALFLALFYILFTLPNAEATEEEKRIIEIDEEKIEINNDINQSSLNITAARTNLKEVKNAAGESWDAVLDIKEAEKLLKEAEQNYKNLREKLFDLLQEKSDLIKVIKNERDDNLKEQRGFDPDKLVKRIGVNLSNACLTMIKNGFDTDCPTYKDLITLDSSDTEISGKFTTDDNGFFHREDPTLTNSWNHYNFDEEIRIFVDPPQGMLDRLRLITIMPNFDNYFVAGDVTQDTQYTLIEVVQDGNSTTKAVNYSYLNKTQDFGRVIYHDRYIDNCKKAVIDAEDWKFILPDTIYFMRNNCDESHTQFEEREVIIPNATSIDITTSPNYQAQQKLLADLERCKERC